TTSRPIMLNHLFSAVFFLSSRRRHTRSKRDWSSDVCSSDLMRDAQYIYDNAERSLSWAQSTQQSRGLFKKLLHGASDQAKVDELTQELEQAQQVYEEISQQHDALAAELEVQQ